MPPIPTFVASVGTIVVVPPEGDETDIIKIKQHTNKHRKKIGNNTTKQICHSPR